MRVPELSVDHGLVAVGVRIAAIEPDPLSIETGRRPVERQPGPFDLLAGVSNLIDRRLILIRALAPREPALGTDPLLLRGDCPLALIEGSLSGVGPLLPLFGEPLALVGQVLPLIGQPVALLGQPFPLVNGRLSFCGHFTRPLRRGHSPAP